MPLISLLQSESDKDPVQAELTWEELTELLTTHERRESPWAECPRCKGKRCTECAFSGRAKTDLGKRGPAWIPATFKEGTKRERGKSAGNISAITVAVFDLDDVPAPTAENPAARRPMSPEEWLATLGAVEASGYRAIVHSSYRYTPSKPKGRVVLELKRPALPGEWPALRQSLATALGLHPDKSTKNLDRLYYLPAAEPGAAVFAGTTDGDTPVDVDTLVKDARIEDLTVRIGAGAEANAAAVARAVAAAADEPVDLDLLRRFLKTADGRNATLLKKIVKGDQLAEQGDRDNTLNAACAAARFCCPTTTPTSALLEIFRESVSKMDHNPGENWLEECRKKLDRHQERKIVADAARQVQQEDVLSRLRAEAARSSMSAPKRPMGPGDDSPGASETDEAPSGPVGIYPDGDVAAWAHEQGCSDVVDFLKRWVITRGNSYYLFVEGRYLPPIPRENLEHSITRDLSRAPVVLYAPTNKGDQKMREVRAILHDYSTVARHSEASLSLQRSFYEPASQTFFEAVCPLRKLTPTFHKEIQTWIDLMDPTGKLTDWIAAVSRLDRQACAVYLDGPGGVGKTLLAAGLARLWTTGAPSEIARVLEGFNESLIQCPLILADETLPQRKGITAELRRLIGSTKRTLNRKFLPAAPLEGAVRLVIAGNNDRILETGEELSANDLEAVAGRIYYLKANKDPADYLLGIGGPPRIQRWINHDWLAEHAMWLRNARKLSEGGRYLVEGNPSEFHRHLAMGSGIAGLVCEWLARFLADPNPQGGTLVFCGCGELWVNTEALAKETSWAKYVPAFKVPSAVAIGRALRGMSFSTGTATHANHTATYHRIDSDLILSWVERLQIGDLAAIRVKLEALNPVILARKEINE